MATHGVSGDTKPKRPQDELGLDVKLESNALENDTWAQATVRDVGKTMTPGNHLYLGSITTHIYKTQNENIVTGAYGIAFKHQLNIGNMNEKLASMAIADLAVRLKQYYGRKHNTTDPKDKRDLVKHDSN